MHENGSEIDNIKLHIIYLQHCRVSSLLLGLMLSVLQYSVIGKMETSSPREGFEDVQEDHLTSKNKDKHRETELYFKIPEAKPLLSKVPIDHLKPKVLIRDIKVHLEYPELLNAAVLPYHSTLQKITKRQAKSMDSTLWQRYVLSNNYRCLYMKFNSQKLQENERKGKRLKTILQKMTLGNEWLMATYILEMSFLSENTSILLRNLQAGALTEQLPTTPDQQISFDSRFESGNLMYAFQALENASREFHLILQNDVNTKGYANWFYFKIHSPQPGPLRLHIVNLQKNFSYFGQGMKPAVYSVREGKSWKMQGNNVSYFKNEMLKCQQTNQKYNTLSFTIEQTNPNDILLVAASPPYTYSRLLLFLQNLEKEAKSNSNLYLRRQSLVTTISSNDCPMITLTWKRDRKEDKTKKKIIIIIARQHPSQIVSSWVAQGLIQTLTSDRPQAEELLRKYIFKIVPMVNIDGVIYGNSRCDISGSDCNRKWTKHSNQSLYPTVTAVRKLVTQLVYEGYQVEYFFDLHGHSRKLGSFIYGCKSFDDIQSRVFAWLLSKATDKFVFEQCRFGVSPFRRETARGFMGGILTNKKAMTLETSFYGYKNSNGDLIPFTPQQLKDLGQSLLTAIHWDTFRTNTNLINWANIRNDIKQTIQVSKLKEDSSEGSDSDPEGEELSQNQKAATFLSPAVASKIGLVQVKVVQKPRKNLKLSQEQKNYNSVQPANREQPKSINSAQIKLLNVSQSLPHKQFVHSRMLRETKSVTKVESFRLRSLDKKEKKRIRIAIEVQRQPRQPMPVLPQFWQQLKSEYQTLISQKKTLLQSAKSHQLSKN